jgi:hypothetical protein
LRIVIFALDLSQRKVKVLRRTDGEIIASKVAPAQALEKILA